MAHKTNDQILLDLALSRGYLLKRDLVDLEESPSGDTDSQAVHPETPWGSRVETLIQRKAISVTVVEQLVSELRQAEVARTLAHPAAPTTSGRATTSSSSVFPVANWDKYQFLSLLGQGGMGMVFKARDRKLGRLVALKFLSGSDAIQTQRFLQEARAQAQLDHPNICKIFEIGEVQGKPYIAMHFVDGLTLDLARSSLSLTERVRLLREAAEAVHVAHSHDVIHRDIKPSNIMIEQTPEGGTRAVLMDFGLARTTGHALTMTGEVLGTPAYMSPEQARGDTRNIDGRTDVYSLGATLYELLAGIPPFHEASVYDLLIKLNEEPAPPLRSRDQSIPEALETIVAKCLSKEPSRRYLTAQALADDLGRFLFEKRITAKKESLGSRLLYRARRNKPVTALSIGLVSSLVALLAYGAWARLQAQRVQESSRREAAAQAALAERLGQEIKDIEWLLRSARQLPIHDLRNEQQLVRKRMSALKAELSSHGESGRALAHYAIGRGHLALQEFPEALSELNQAAAAGNHRPEMYYALGMTLGKHYERAMYDARMSGGGPWAQKQLQNIAPKYLTPAIAALEKSRSLKTEAPTYLEALLSFYQGNYDETLRLSQLTLAQAPWLYEAAVLAGHVHLERALKLRDSGDDGAGLPEFKKAVTSYETAAQVGRSDSLVYEGLAEARARILQTQAWRGVRDPEMFEQALAAARQISVTDPQNAAGPLKLAFIMNWSQGFGNSGLNDRNRCLDCLKYGRDALRLEPGNPYAAEMVANCLPGTMSPNDFFTPRGLALIEEAIAILEPVVRAHPTFVWGRNDLGLLYNGYGDFHTYRQPELAKKYILEKTIPTYRDNITIAPSELAAYSNILDALARLAWKPLTVEETASVIQQADAILAQCAQVSKTADQCPDNDGIMRTALAWRAYLQGLPTEPLLKQAKDRWRTLSKLGVELLDATQFMALGQLIEALSLQRQQKDPASALRQMEQSLQRCFRFDASDGNCQALTVRKQWLEAELLPAQAAQRLRRALTDAERILSGTPLHPDYLWIASETHLRLAKLPQLDASARDSHVSAGLLIADKLVTEFPAHALGFVTKGNLYLCQADLQRSKEAKQSQRSAAQTSFAKAQALDPRIVPYFQDSLRKLGL